MRHKSFKWFQLPAFKKRKANQLMIQRPSRLGLKGLEGNLRELLEKSRMALERKD